MNQGLKNNYLWFTTL